MKIEKIMITPTVAKQMLTTNTANRPIKANRVLQYSKDMKNGLWKEDTGETIKVSETGKILDGQHRLLAILKSSVSVNLHVATGVKDESFSVIDTGVKRTSSDVFNISGIKNSTTASGIVNRYIIINRSAGGSKEQITNAESLKVYYENPLKWNGIFENTIRWYRLFSRILPASFIGGYYAKFFDIDNDMSFSFFEQLCTGESISNPTINVLRNALINDKLSSNKMNNKKLEAIIIKTWNCYRKGTSLSFLRFDPTKEETLKAI